MTKELTHSERIERLKQIRISLGFKNKDELLKESLVRADEYEKEAIEEGILAASLGSELL